MAGLPGRVAVILLALVLGSVARADERILDFTSDIVVHPDASMTVTETIAVRAEGDLIRRGIFRDFPTDYTDRLGNRYRVGFEILSVTRGGRPEPWHTASRSNGVRVYAGSQDRFLEPGVYRYAITYRTDRQLGYFADHDELYWNVTGNGWDLPIDRASATVTLPESVPMDAVSIEGYTGVQGSTEHAYTAEVTGGQAVIAATRGLGPREGLTLVVGWPKGHVYEPTAADRLQHVLYDNRGLAAAVLGLLGVLAYLLYAWYRHGRDPEPGVIFPHYEPPPGYSPASARFIREMGYDDRAFTAAVISLAVKGWLEIDEDGDEYTLARRGPGAEPSAGEKELLVALFAEGSPVVLEKENHKVLRKARRAHERALKRDYEKIYFFTNSLLLLPSLLATVGLAFGIVVTGSFRPLVLAPLALIVVAHVVFYFLLKAPTRRGRALVDKLEGFRMYLEVAEKDELNLRNPPERTPELFEKYLPFALALDVEQEWAEQFADVFSRMRSPDGSNYHPAWYHGSFSPGRVGQFAAGVGAGLTTAIASASTPPGSSSGGGGGGFSGGGGGGGGGGGW